MPPAPRLSAAPVCPHRFITRPCFLDADLRPRPRPLTPAQAAAAQEAADTALRAALLQDAIEVRTREMRDLNHRLADEAFHRAEGIQTARIRGSSSGGVSSNGRTEGQARPRLQAIKFAAPFWGSQSGAPAAFSPASSSSTSSLSTSRLSTTSASASSSSTSSDSSCPAPVDSNQVHRAEAAVSVLELSEAKSSHRGRGWFGWRSHAPEKLHYNSGEPTGAGSGRGSALGISTSSGSGQQQHDAELDVHDNDEDFQAWLRVSGLTAEALFDAERQQEQQQQAALQQGQGFEQGHEQEEGTSGEVLAFVGGQQAHAGSGEKTKGQLGQGRNTQTSSW